VTYDTPVPGLGVGLQWRYLSAVHQDVTSPNPLLTGSLGGSPATIPNYMYFDMTASYVVNKNLSVRVGANNILDKDPPLLSQEYISSAFDNANTYPEVYDSLGRYLFANVTMQF
jgi:outer membrane receptor protein involved in Fe transport